MVRKSNKPVSPLHWRGPVGIMHTFWRFIGQLGAINPAPPTSKMSDFYYLDSSVSSFLVWIDVFFCRIIFVNFRHVLYNLNI